MSNMTQGEDVYLGKSKDILLHPILLCAFGPLPVCGLDQSIYFLRSPISPFAQMKFPECFHLSLRIHPNEHICPNFKMYLSKLQNVFVQIAQYICPNCKMYLSKLPNVFVQIAKCICPNCKHFQNFPPVPSYSACCCPTVRGRGVA